MSGDRTDSVSVRAPAKINLDLSVGALGDDGFHPVHTVYHAVSVFDDVTVTATDSGLELEVRGDHVDGVPTDASNLVLRAARLVARRGGVQGGARILLHKGIPVAAGLAGGSPDA